MSSTATVQLGLLLRAVVWLAVLCCALAPATVSGNDHSSSASRRWVVLDTDIGGDDDDTWALALLLQSTEIDLRMVLTDSHNAEARAKIVAKTLEGAGRTNITNSNSSTGAHYAPCRSSLFDDFWIPGA